MAEPYVAENPDKTRRAVAKGRKVQFFLRKRAKDSYRSPRPWYTVSYANMDEAIEAADLYAKSNRVKGVPKRGAVH